MKDLTETRARGFKVENGKIIYFSNMLDGYRHEFEDLNEVCEEMNGMLEQYDSNIEQIEFWKYMAKQMQERLSCAFEEIKQIKDYNYFIFNETNREVEAAIEIENIISSEKNKAARYEEEIIRKFKEEL